MKIKVLQDFEDRYTKEIHRKGKIIEVTKQRFGEINSSDFGTLAEEVIEKDKPKK